MHDSIMDDAGELDSRITFQRFNGSRDALGDLHYHDDKDWTDAFTVWGKIRSVGAGEFYKAEQSDSYITHNIKIRHRGGVLAEMRIKCGSRIFRIKSPPIDLKGRRQWLMLKAEELVE